jgi:hypothetical protein
MSGRFCSLACAVFFKRDAVAVEEPPECGDAGMDTPLSQGGLDLGKCDVPILGLGNAQNRLGMPLDRLRAPIAAQRKGATIALLAFALAPTPDARRVHTKAFTGLAMRKSVRYRRKNPNTKID